MPKPHDIAAFLEVVGQPFELDPASVAVLVDLLLEWPQKMRERVIFQALRERRTPLDRRNLAHLIRAAVAADAGLVRPLRNSIKSGGRCSGGARPVLIEVLGLSPPAPVIPAVIPSSPATSGHPEEEVDLLLNPDTTTLYSLPRLFDALAEVERRRANAILRVKDFVFASGLAIVATWANARGRARTVVAEDRHTN